jgi:nicotinamidase-related amidase
MQAIIMGEHAMRGRLAIICAVIGVLGATTVGTISTAVASDIIDEWANVKTPAAPAIKGVTVDPKTTALLMGDIMNQVCGKRPRCVAALPAIKKLLDEARAAKVAVIYSIIPNSTVADIITDVAPTADEPTVQSGVDKFFKTNLEQILKDKGIQTVIVVGTSAEGVVTYTGGGAAIRGFNVIFPVDGVGSVEPFAEQYVAWHMTHAPIISSKVTLTRTSMIKFK